MKPTSTKSDLNLALKLAIIKSRKRQGEIARRAHIGEVRFSKIVTRRIEATPKERERITTVLETLLESDQSDLFADQATA